VLSIVGALAFVAIEKFWSGTVAGNHFLISAGVALGIAATTWTILGLRSGNPGLVAGAVIIMLTGNPLSGLTSAPNCSRPRGARQASTFPRAHRRHCCAALPSSTDTAACTPPSC
jgi:hypothetical protein